LGYRHAWLKRIQISAMRQQNPKSQACDKFQLVADNLLALMEQGTVPWRQPWSLVPTCNAITGHQYGGLNPLLAQVDVIAKGYQYPLFAGFKQGQEKGWKLRKGSKATWLRWGGTIRKEEEDPVTGEREEKFFTAIKWLQVFNLDCFDDSESSHPIADVIDKYRSPENPDPRIDEAEWLIFSQDADIQHGGSKAYYQLSKDQIHLPHFEDFSSAELYYSTAIHELVHWTGQESRLGRDLRNKFASEDYAFEEMVAELGASFVCNELGITPALEHHASYLEEWLELIGTDNKAFFKATTLAQKAANWLLDNAAVDLEAA
jgi:antirestriction protein ArdC